MSLKCSLSGHDWNFGVCSRCGLSIGGLRDRKHNKPCQKNHRWTGCRCAVCGVERPAEGENAFHIYEGCRCKICGKPLPEDSDRHEWVNVAAAARTCQKCKNCGKFRTHQFDEKEVCIYCRKSRVYLTPPAQTSLKKKYTGGPCPGHDWEHHVKVKVGPGWMYGRRCKICGKSEPYDIKL